MVLLDACRDVRILVFESQAITDCKQLTIKDQIGRIDNPSPRSANGIGTLPPTKYTLGTVAT